MRKKYVKEDIQILWESTKCTHSGKCVRGLPEVFNVNNHPWINVDAAEKDKILNQVKLCPSGALSILDLNE